MRTKRQASTGPSITLSGMLIAEITWRGLIEKSQSESLEVNSIRNEKHALEVKNAIDLWAKSVNSVDIDAYE